MTAVSIHSNDQVLVEDPDQLDDDHVSPLRSALGLTWVMSVKNFQVRYKRAALGVLWAVVQPSFQAVFLSFVFLSVFHYGKGIHDYPLYVLSGMLPWAFFASGVIAATTVIVDNASLIKKVAVPRVIFPISAVGGVALAFVASLGVLVGAAFFLGEAGWNLLLLPVAVVLEVLIVIALGTLACSFHVAYRDVRYIVESSLLVGLYATPVLYELSKAPPRAQAFLRINPMSGVMTLYRTALLGRPLDLASVVIGAAVTAVLLALALASFARRSDEFPDLV